jgi:hypothetical protein
MKYIHNFYEWLIVWSEIFNDYRQSRYSKNN